MYKSNRWFQIIWQNLTNHFTILNKDEKLKIDNVIDFLITGEDIKDSSNDDSE